MPEVEEIDGVSQTHRSCRAVGADDRRVGADVDRSMIDDNNSNTDASVYLAHITPLTPQLPSASSKPLPVSGFWKDG